MASAAPQLRGLLSSHFKKHFGIACVVTIFTTAFTKVWLYDYRINKYNEFYKNYDAEKTFERLRDAGAFQSVAPGGGTRFEDEE